MKYAVPTFVLATLAVAVAVYILITSSTPLAPSQAIGTGVAFLFGWIGLAYSGSEALRGMIRRRRARLASEERAPTRSDAVSRRFWQRVRQPEDASFTSSGEQAPRASEEARASVASAERAGARAAAVVRRYTLKGSVPEPALERLAEEPGSEEDQALDSSLTRASMASTRPTSETRNAAS
jgi:hypothetical protein